MIMVDCIVNGDKRGGCVDVPVGIIVAVLIVEIVHGRDVGNGCDTVQIFLLITKSMHQIFGSYAVSLW